MSSEVSSSNGSSDTLSARERQEVQPFSEPPANGRQLSSRRSFLVGAGTGALGVGLLADVPLAAAHRRLTEGDEAILRFLSAAEILETDLWQQYNELAGIQDSEVPGGSGNPAYAEAVAVLDEDMAQYIHDNTEDEMSHVAFIAAYLNAHGARGVNLDSF